MSCFVRSLHVEFSLRRQSQCHSPKTCVLAFLFVHTSFSRPREKSVWTNQKLMYSICGHTDVDGDVSLGQVLTPRSLLIFTSTSTGPIFVNGLVGVIRFFGKSAINSSLWCDLKRCHLKHCRSCFFTVRFPSYIQYIWHKCAKM